MADIFISYSKMDHDEARMLAAFLEAEGYSVWWDTNLISGEAFRKTIMTELGRARAAIVIWSIPSSRTGCSQRPAAPMPWTSTVLSDDIRAICKDVLSARPIDQYGVREAGLIACECSC